MNIQHNIITKNSFLIYLQKTLKTGKTALRRSEEEKILELAYLIINKFGQITIGYKYHVCSFEDGNKYAITKIEYGKGKIKADASINKH